MLSYLGLPTIDGKDDRGASSPERPALHMPDPLSMTTGVPCSVLMFLERIVLAKELIYLIINFVDLIKDTNYHLNLFFNLLKKSFLN